MMKKCKILITGGLGFIGHNLSIALKNNGFDVSIIDNFSQNIKNLWHQKIIDQRLALIKHHEIVLFEGDTTDKKQVEQILLNEKPDKIIHTAAIPDARLSNLDPANGFNQNLLATQILLEVIRTNKLEINQFTYFSSSMVYGDFKTESVDENSPKDPKGIYGASKLGSELLIKAYHNIFNIPYTIIRPSALYGPRCINNRITQIFIENALLGKPLTIQGDGSQKLDFTYIDDFIEGMVCTQTHSQGINEVFNLTTGNAESISILVEILKNYFPGLIVNYTEWDKTVPIRGTLNIENIKRLGYVPKYSLTTGYQKYIEWYLARADEYRNSTSILS